MKSLIKCLQFCGRQEIGLQGHRDDDTHHILNKGNFKALIQFRIDVGDKVLENHLIFSNCSRNATYTSKTSQNDLLLCMKEFIQNVIVNEIKNQNIGPYFGIQCDEVRDSSNWEQLGLVVRYLKHFTPVERLLEFVPCTQTTGEALCENTIGTLAKASLDISFCHSQTLDGAGNMAGKHVGCAALITKASPKALYHYCCSHDLNLALCKSCEIKEVHLMLDSLKQLGMFFKYSPKRSRRLEQAIEDFNSHESPANQIKKTKFGLFCETRWVEKHTTLLDFDLLYKPLLSCLDAIGSHLNLIGMLKQKLMLMD